MPPSTFGKTGTFHKELSFQLKLPDPGLRRARLRGSFKGFLIIIMAQWPPNPYANYEGPLYERFRVLGVLGLLGVQGLGFWGIPWRTSWCDGVSWSVCCLWIACYFKKVKTCIMKQVYP